MPLRSSKFDVIIVTFLFGAQDLLQRFGPTKRRIQDERENPTWCRVPVQLNQGRHDPTRDLVRAPQIWP
jgi:hypothetical protein